MVKMARQKFWAMCLKCEHGWTPRKSRGKIQCVKCGSRNVLRAAPDVILDNVRKKAQEKAERDLREWRGKDA